MLLPEMFGNRFFEDFDNDPWQSSFFNFPATKASSMKTDIRESENGYSLSIELPGFKKEDVNIGLKDGYLTIEATESKNTDEKDDKGNYIRRERYSGSCSRSYFVGKDLQPEDVHAKFDNGVLEIDIPKVDARKAVEAKSIQID